MRKVYLAVINDLVTDQRVHRVAQTLYEYGAEVELIGRRFTHSPPVDDRDYSTVRFRLIFNRRFLFYGCYNFRLFFYLLFRGKGILAANDLDTLPACWLVSKLRKMTLVYDCHEYFTEVPELINRKFVRNFWLMIERLLLPRIRHAYTVSEPIAGEYHEKYGTDFKVIRNFPRKEKDESKRPDLLKCGPDRIIIYQGSLNPGRGLESMILAMKFLINFQFQIFGDGPLRKKLEKLVQEANLNERVIFMGRKPFSELKFYTRQAFLAVSLEENLGKNYYYSLPNKLFDYIQARVPVLVSDLPEMKLIVEKYEVGIVSDTHDPAGLAGIINEMMSNDEKRMIWKKNLLKASNELCWEAERDKLIGIYKEAGLVI